MRPRRFRQEEEGGFFFAAGAAPTFAVVAIALIVTLISGFRLGSAIRAGNVRKCDPATGSAWSTDSIEHQSGGCGYRWCLAAESNTAADLSRHLVRRRYA